MKFHVPSVLKFKPVLHWFQGSIIRENSLFSQAKNLIRQQKPNCTFSAFRQIVSNTASGYLPGNGTWKRNGRRKLDRFYPDVCHLEYGPKLSSKQLTSCLHRDNIRHIVLMGDSNGDRFFHGLHWLLSNLDGVDCTPVSKHICLNWNHYDKDMYAYHRCPCGNTTSGRCVVCYENERRNRGTDRTASQALCRINVAEGVHFNLVIEYSAVLFVIENKALLMNATGCQPSGQKPVILTESKSTQQYLFAEFYADPRPDLFILFENAHERCLLRELVRDVDTFISLLDQYIISKTRFIWVSRVAEDVKRKPKYWREMRYENGTMSRMEYLDVANRIMYSRMRQRFLNNKNLLLFPDLLQMSKPVLDDFNIDGVHMKPEWYQHVLSYLLQTLCN